MLFLRLKKITYNCLPTTGAREDNLCHQINATYGFFLELQYSVTDSDWRSQKAQASELDQRLQSTPFSRVFPHPS